MALRDRTAQRRALGPLRVASLNLASGRDRTGRSLPATELTDAVAGLDADVIAVQEVDVGQNRSHGDDQPAIVAHALGAVDWRYAATLDGEPRPIPYQSWTPVDPAELRGLGEGRKGPRYGVALFSRRCVRRWHVLGMGAGRALLPVPGPEPRTGRVGVWWFPDEPRAAIAAELDGLTVIATHLSFGPHTATRQLLAIRSWKTRLPGPTVVVGDLNLPGAVPARLLGGRRAVSAATFPASGPRLQLDHLITLGNLATDTVRVQRLAVGDHLLVSAALRPA